MFIRKVGFPQICFDADGASGGGSASPSAPAASTSPASASSSSSSSASSPPTPSPASTSAPAAASESAKSPTSKDASAAGDNFFDFDDTMLGIDDDEVVAPTQDPTTSKEPAATTPAAAQTTPPAQPQQAAPSENSTQPPAQPTPQTPQGSQEASPQIPSPAEPGRLADMMEQNASALIEHLAANEFKLSQEDLEALETDAPGHIPKLLARTHHRIMTNTMRQMEKIVPAIIQRYMAVQERQKNSEDAFFSQWPDLDPVAHRGELRTLAGRYRQMFPQTTREQMMAELGPMLMAQLKIAPGSRQQQAQPTAAAPARTNGRPPAQPFKPAQSGPAAAPQPQADAPWDFLGGSANDSE